MRSTGGDERCDALGSDADTIEKVIDEVLPLLTRRTGRMIVDAQGEQKRDLVGVTLPGLPVLIAGSTNGPRCGPGFRRLARSAMASVSRVSSG